jgi:hypothetical protein
LVQLRFPRRLMFQRTDRKLAYTIARLTSVYCLILLVDFLLLYL